MGEAADRQAKYGHATPGLTSFDGLHEPEEVLTPRRIGHGQPGQLALGEPADVVVLVGRDVAGVPYPRVAKNACFSRAGSLQAIGNRTASITVTPSSSAPSRRAAYSGDSPGSTCPRAGPTGPDDSPGSGGGERVAPSRPERVPRRQCAWAASLRPWDESTTSRLYLVCRQAVDQAAASQRRLLAGLHAAGALVIRDAALARRKGRPVGSLTIPLTLLRFEHVY